ncbi:hypothetical protein [Rhodococcus sp. IEGM 1379]|uniref:hypothetical protein n=1 Tax=Rhodococcus sp. IEGM 1379 TaxID=3047086 RepID=UPI0024B6FEE4|nr:hypothetical protein [Rhodococcus sp. IEGM 1379]MDI9915471.1 hypothetical protein [Rhodococcus sp. IEGM 1379]
MTPGTDCSPNCAGMFSTIQLVLADSGYSGRLLDGAKSVLALQIDIIKRTPGSTGFPVKPEFGR